MLTRQSTPITSPPAACSSPTKAALRGPQEARRAGAEVNHWNARRANSFDESAGIRSHIAHIIVGTQRADPAIEYLNRACSRSHLADREWPQHIYQLAHQPAPQSLVAIHHLLGLVESFRRTAFNHVTRECEW